MTAAIHSMPDLLAALRARRDELELTHEAIDFVAGWAAGYSGKLLAPEPIKNLGWMSLGTMLDALAIELVMVENAEQRKLVEGRWKTRQRPKNGGSLSIRLASQNEPPKQLPITIDLHEQLKLSAYMKKIGKRGGKRRLKTMTKRARQRAAAHAARKRWSKQNA